MSVPIISIVVRGEFQGIFLGWAFHAKLSRPFQDSVVDVDSIEDLIRIRMECCGRFVYFDFSDGRTRISTDAGALFPVVYDSSAPAVASSPAALSLCQPLNLDEALRKEIIRYDTTEWYPFGLTSYEGVRRLLPFDLLDISTGLISRNEFALRSIASSGESYPAAAFEAVCSNIHSIACGRAVRMHLTAGYDSRMVLAAALASGIIFDCETIEGASAGAKLDVLVARKLAAIAGVRHRTIRSTPPSEQELADWQGRTGGAVVDAVMHLCRTEELNFDGRAVLSGACGEVGRGFYWMESDLDCVGLDSITLSARLGFAPTPTLIASGNDWLARFDSDMQRTMLLDYAYIELRLGCWAGAATPGHNVPFPSFSPFNSYSVYREMLAARPIERFHQQYALSFIKHGANMLAEIPFNRASGMHRFLFPGSELKGLLGSRYHLMRSYARRLRSIIR
jgi:hypothetical protein